MDPTEEVEVAQVDDSEEKSRRVVAIRALGTAGASDALLTLEEGLWTEPLHDARWALAAALDDAFLPPEREDAEADPENVDYWHHDDVNAAEPPGRIRAHEQDLEVDLGHPCWRGESAAYELARSSDPEARAAIERLRAHPSYRVRLAMLEATCSAAEAAAGGDAI